MTDQLPTMDDLLDAYHKAHTPIAGFGNARRAGITAVIDKLGAWDRVAPQSRPIPEGWSNETPPAGELVFVSLGNGRSHITSYFGRSWADPLSMDPTAIWHPLPPLPVDPRVEP